MTPLKLKTYSVIPLAKWLADQSLPGRMSRARNRFIAIIRPKLTEIEDTRLELAKKYSKKGEDGNALEIEENGVKRFDLEDKDQFQKEWEAYSKEDYIIDVTPANEGDILTIGEMILNTTEEFKDDENAMAATLYDGWCEAFEQSIGKPAPAPTQAAA